MKQSGRKHGSAFKAKVALSAIRGDQTLSEVAARTEAYPTLINNWKKQLAEGAPELFSSGHTKQNKSQEALIAKLYQHRSVDGGAGFFVGQVRSMSRTQKRGMVDRDHADVLVVRQCELLSISCSSVYYSPIETSDYELELMRLIDSQYLWTPFYDSRKMTAWLRGRDTGSTKSAYIS